MSRERVSETTSWPARHGSQRRGRQQTRRRPILIGALIGLVVAAAGVSAIVGWSGGTSSSADSPGRGAPMTLPASLAAQAPALDAAASVGSVNGTRSQIGAGELSASVCLDKAAADTAAAFADGKTPAAVARVAGCSPAVSWELATWGWVSGADPTGEAQLHAAFSRAESGATGLVSADATRIGLSLTKQMSSGRVTGFVLVWIVAP